MGATNFSNVSFGKTADDAFRAAQDEMRYSYGHEGYTGTIAEKSDFASYAVPKGCGFNSMVNWMMAACDATYHDQEAEYAYSPKAALPQNTPLQPNKKAAGFFLGQGQAGQGTCNERLRSSPLAAQRKNWSAHRPVARYYLVEAAWVNCARNAGPVASSWPSTTTGSSRPTQ